MKKIFWVHGTKGGVGKSVSAAILTEYALRATGSATIVEADGSIPDVGRRFNNIEGVNAVSAPITDAKSIYAALAKLEGIDAENVIINLPANATILDTKASEIGEVINELEYDSRCLFVVGPGDDSARLAGESMEDGIVSICSSSVAIVNQFFGAELEDFAWFTSSARTDWLKSGKTEFMLPALEQRVTKNPDYLAPGTLSFLATKESPLCITDRMLIRRWLAVGYTVCDQITGGE